MLDTARCVRGGACLLVYGCKLARQRGEVAGDAGADELAVESSHTAPVVVAGDREVEAVAPIELDLDESRGQNTAGKVVGCE